MLPLLARLPRLGPRTRRAVLVLSALLVLASVALLALERRSFVRWWRTLGREPARTAVVDRRPRPVSPRPPGRAPAQPLRDPSWPDRPSPAEVQLQRTREAVERKPAEALQLVVPPAARPSR